MKPVGLTMVYPVKLYIWFISFVKAETLRFSYIFEFCDMQKVTLANLIAIALVIAELLGFIGRLIDLTAIY